MNAIIYMIPCLSDREATIKVISMVGMINMINMIGGCHVLLVIRLSTPSGPKYLRRRSVITWRCF